MLFKICKAPAKKINLAPLCGAVKGDFITCTKCGRLMLKKSVFRFNFFSFLLYFQVNDRVIDLEIDVHEKCIYMAYLASDASHKVSEIGNLKLFYFFVNVKSSQLNGLV